MSDWRQVRICVPTSCRHRLYLSMAGRFVNLHRHCQHCHPWLQPLAYCSDAGSNTHCLYRRLYSCRNGRNSELYTLYSDSKGNAYLYGFFAEDATVSVKQGDVTLKDYTFTAEKNPNGTEHNKSYALDARPVIDGTLGGKATATEDDITALVEQLKAYVDNGITTIIVTGETPATIEVEGYTIPAIGETIYRLRNDNSYNSKIDLILQDVTEIADQGFYYAYALNSITLPKVTTVGDEAFQGCDYMKQITFSSVVTSIVQKNGLTFHVGDEVDGCDLILNCG